MLHIFQVHCRLTLRVRGVVDVIFSFHRNGSPKNETYVFLAGGDCLMLISGVDKGNGFVIRYIVRPKVESSNSTARNIIIVVGGGL